MKNIFMLMCSLFLSMAHAGSSAITLTGYSALCATETDPLKRQHYCALFEKKNSPALRNFRKHLAVA